MSENTIDPAAFKELQDTAGVEFTSELVATFLEETPPLLAELASALAARQEAVFRRTAHSLKTNALTFGALKLATLARELELRDINSEAKDNSLRLDDFMQEYERVATELAELCRV